MATKHVHRTRLIVYANTLYSTRARAARKTSPHGTDQPGCGPAPYESLILKINCTAPSSAAGSNRRRVVSWQQFIAQIRVPAMQLIADS